MMLTAMLNSYPQTTGDIELRLHTLEAALKDVSEKAIVEACMAYIRAEVQGHNSDFAPSVPKFVETANQFEALATHKKWLDENRASLRQVPQIEPFRPVKDGVSRVIDEYRANYKERVKANPELSYVDSIRQDFQAATGKALKIPSPKGAL